ncbi:MarR family transcriptional regulator [Photobacterium gaetbulicola]|uniref:MarR family transcriptional regulator n=1 Tax=Photobacterium gaetbulicola Gung47 TaxID=658445 RepID=A0A0C5WR44_9GAMM|nr:MULTISPECIES: MarR family transcriptional regulator [Photobacterium]AJR08777.1 MarR family transcriptional regulator [Photobacterium gaetbulicola Gung47]PSU10407.1 MarR family transcriptional regulator [Photobacterium gaetbulicola]WEM40894.1 MarR family transcriptional regulator [Photobacterium sp. DA100]
MAQKLSDNVCFALYTASNALVRAYRPLLDEFDLTYPQYIVMQSLWYSDGVSLKEVSNSTQLDSGTLTPIVKRLEAKALLTRKVSAQDERKKVISLTDKGLLLRDKAKDLKSQLEAKSSMQPEDVEMLRKLCLELADKLS